MALQEVAGTPLGPYRRHPSNLAACLLLVAALHALPASCHAATPVVAVDAGHSLASPGATSARGIPEHQFNLALAQVVRETLSLNGARAVSVGDKGDMQDLRQRTAIASAEAASFFLSIHHDSVQPHYLQSWPWQGKRLSYSDRFSGFSLFVSRLNPQLDTSLRCASSIGSALRQAGFRPSEHHAEAIPGENRSWADRQNGVYYFDNLVVLKTATMPAVLLEAGIIVNREEEELLQKQETRKAIADAVAQGLHNCGAID